MFAEVNPENNVVRAVGPLSGREPLP